MNGWRARTGLLLLFALGATGAGAASLTLDLEGPDAPTRARIHYACEDGTRVDAEYVNAGPDMLALVAFGRTKVLMASVTAASGARYVGRNYQWWTKGDAGVLSDLSRGTDAGSVNCREAK